MKPYPNGYFSQKVIVCRTMAVMLAAALIFSACTTPPPPPSPKGGSSAAFETGVPGGVMVNTVEISARVTDIDYTRRTVVLLGPDGEKKHIAVGPQAVNFDQIRVGDLVKAHVTEELVVGLIEESTVVPEGKALTSLGYMDTEEVEPMPDGAAGVVALAARGAQPGGLVAGTVRMIATVVAIDPVMRTAKLKFKDGRTRTFPVRDDIDLSRHQVGERVLFQITEMIAISVEKQ
ncbi:hypothetical protein DSCW_22600 [Desulfosarcina widdelii]|uniref:Lipoprotein n=1 Tax=Desulfosarcina widdelii TaxID=947919 RepID=A0A5K7Z4J0_9BACT|nr:hypothetical protein [Desulfosarcina widdelii]BBO74843.1 hypothetical protein DSCW_22600 [Desulfosarcina widdelii]